MEADERWASNRGSLRLLAGDLPPEEIGWTGTDHMNVVREGSTTE